MLKVNHVLDDKKILYFVFCGLVEKFQGVSIPGFCKVDHNSDNFFIVPGVRTITLDLPEQGSWGDSFNTWNDIVEFLDFNYSLAVVQELVRAEFPATARRLDQVAFESGEVSDKTVRSIARRRRPRNVVKGSGKNLHAH